MFRNVPFGEEAPCNVAYGRVVLQRSKQVRHSAADLVNLRIKISDYPGLLRGLFDGNQPAVDGAPAAVVVQHSKRVDAV